MSNNYNNGLNSFAQQLIGVNTTTLPNTPNNSIYRLGEAYANNNPNANDVSIRELTYKLKTTNGITENIVYAKIIFRLKGGEEVLILMDILSKKALELKLDEMEINFIAGSINLEFKESTNAGNIGSSLQSIIDLLVDYKAVDKVV